MPTIYPYDSERPYESNTPYDATPLAPSTGARQIMDGISAEYRYYLVDLLTNVVLAELPFTDVTYERSLSKAGAFSGKIPYIAATQGLDLYDSTMPGKSCIFILRDGVCVWGGVIWSRAYSPVNKTLTIDASEFISLFYHRVVWQTLYYGTPSVPCVKYSAGSSIATVFTVDEHGYEVGETVRILNLNSALNGDHTITSIPSPASYTFASGATLALSPSNTGVCRVVLDSYETTRQIIGHLLEDFSGIGFENDDIRPATEEEYSVTVKQAAPIPASSPAASTYTLTTSIGHDLIAGQEVEVVSVDSNVNGFRVITATPTYNTFEVEVPGTFTIGATALSGISTSNIVSKSLEGYSIGATNKLVVDNLATITLGIPHGLVAGDYISVSEMANNTSYSVSTTGSTGVFTVTVSSAANLVPGMRVTGHVDIPLGTIIKNVSGLTLTLNYAPTSNISTTLSYTNSSTLNGTYQVYSVPSSTQVTYAVDTPDTPSTAISVGKIAYKNAIVTSDTPHGLTAGTSIVVDGIGVDFDGNHVVASVPDTTTIKYNVFATLNQITEAVWGGTVKSGSRVSYSTYGSFAANSDFIMEVDQSTTTNVIGYDQQVFRGSDLKMFGEILDEFAKDINGFEYRVDCDFTNGTFTKTFVFVPFYDPPTRVNVVLKELVSNVATLTTEVAHGLTIGQDIVVSDVGVAFNGTYEVVSTPTSTSFTYLSYGYNNVPSSVVSGYIGLVHPLSALGADRVIFEYPGNIMDFSFSENAETSATRMWVAGNADGLDSTASQPYAGHTDTSLLNAGWPLLDQVENKSDNISTSLGESALGSYASDYLDESRPPEGSFTITVNGSLDPKVGDYYPGDWCSVVLDDDFVRARLANDLEPRSDVIVRKIESIKVSVPNSTSFPEKVDLTLIPEWREDRRNAQ